MNKTQGETLFSSNNLGEPILSLGKCFIILANWIFKADVTFLGKPEHICSIYWPLLLAII